MHLGGHHHGHGCDHSAADLKLNRSFAIAVILNALLVVGEALGGFWTSSMALLADAGHNLSDVAGLLLAWGAHWLRGKQAAGRWTYGWRSFTILASQLNGILIVVAIAGMSIESIRRLAEPSEVAELPVLLVALLATVLNFATARLLVVGMHDLNVRGAYLHMLADAAVSFAVVLGALVIMGTGWYWLDPAISLAICVVLALGTWGLLRDATTMMMNAAPADLNLDDVREFMESSPEIENLEDLHVWSVSTTDLLLTARLHCPDLKAEAQDELLMELHAGLESHFGISHATLEIVHGGSARTCSLSPQ